MQIFMRFLFESRCYGGNVVAISKELIYNSTVAPNNKNEVI